MKQPTKVKTKTARKQKYAAVSFWYDINRDFAAIFDILPPNATAEQVEWWERHLKSKARALLDDVAHASFRNGRHSRDQEK